MKKRRDQYNKSVKGKLGGLDIITHDQSPAYVLNKAGAKVYKDASKHPILAIPTLSNTSQEGAIHEVLSVGMLPPSYPIITVKAGDLPVVYRLPSELSEWAQYSIASSQSGFNAFPCKIEFGVLNGRAYAEML